MNHSWWNKIYTPLILALVFVVGMSVGSHFLNQPNFQLPLGKSKMEQILNYIENDYVDSLDIVKLEKDAINQMIEELDPHSSYITPEYYHQVVDPLIGNFDGIGIQFRMIRDSLTIMLPLEGGPSIKAGLKAGDRIVIADGDTIAGRNLNSDEVVKKLKGPRGTKVDLKIVRSGADSLLIFTVERDKIPTYSLDASYMINDSLGYIKISRFAATTTDEFNQSLSKLLKENMSALILDLRGNSGGYLRAAIDMADAFLKEDDLIVYTKGKNRPEKRYYAQNHGDFEEGSLMILIDENSASASEIVAGAIQDNDRGIILGRRSFGKGLVQEQIDFTDGSALRLTVARYYTPTGRCIQRPYDNGKNAYYADHYHRVLEDLNTEKDTLQLEDTTQFITPKGKIVYGGGGIKPDIDVPLDTSLNYYFYNRMIRNSIIVEYGIDYFNKNSKNLQDFKDVKDFTKHFQLKEHIWDDLLQIANDQGISATETNINENKSLILNLFKSEIARLLFGDAAYFYVLMQEDRIYQEALKNIN
jgi:carboxyl-terminal processing protease